MIHPSYVELMDVINEGVESGEQPVVNSRYSVVCATAKRARQIIDGADLLEDSDSDIKPLSMAVKELYDGKLKILTPDEIIEKERELSAIEEEIARLEIERKAALLAKEAEEAKAEENSDELEETDTED